MSRADRTVHIALDDIDHERLVWLSEQYADCTPTVLAREMLVQIIDSCVRNEETP